MRTWRKAIGVRRRMVVVGQGKRQLDRVVEWKPKAFLVILFISLLLFIVIIVIVHLSHCSIFFAKDALFLLRSSQLNLIEVNLG